MIHAGTVSEITCRHIKNQFNGVREFFQVISGGRRYIIYRIFHNKNSLFFYQKMNRFDTFEFLHGHFYVFFKIKKTVCSVLKEK